MSDRPHSRWGIAEDCAILSRRFGEQYAIYHQGSGDTHLLNKTGFVVVDQLNRGPQSFDRLLERVTDEFEFESTGEAEDYLHSLLRELCELTIVERLNT